MNMYYHPLIKPRVVVDATQVVLLADTTLPVSIEASDQVYYNEFVYKVSFEGSSVWHDMDFHFGLSEYLDKNITSYRFRNGWSVKCRSVYFSRYRDVEAVVNKFKHGIISLAGPINDKHLQSLLGTQDKTPFTPVFRDKLFYAKYDCKIEFSFWQFRNNNKYKYKDSDYESSFTDIKAFVDANTTNYRWSNPQSSYSYYNTLFLNYADAEAILPMLRITNKKNIVGAYQVFLKTDLLKEQK